MKNEQKFWMVWSPQGRAPTMKHWDKDYAQAEAARLAAQNPGHHFYVLKAVSLVDAEKPNIRCRKLMPGCEQRIPF
jgi:hypothetical protein